MPVVARNTREDGSSGLSTPITVLVCIASVVVALTLGQSYMFHIATGGVVTDLRVSILVTLGVLAWRLILIVWRRNKGAPPTPSSTKFPLSPTAIVHLPQKPESIYLADTERGQDYANRIPSTKFSPPPAYSPRLMKSSPTSNKKSTPTLNLDVNCDAEATQPSPIRSASFNPNTKTQSLSSRISSRMSIGAKKLYVHLSG